MKLFERAFNLGLPLLVHVNYACIDPAFAVVARCSSIHKGGRYAFCHTDAQAATNRLSPSGVRRIGVTARKLADVQHEVKIPPANQGPEKRELGRGNAFAYRGPTAARLAARYDPP